MATDYSLDDLKAAKDRYGDFLRALPNVNGVGIGPKITNGVATGRAAVKVFVSRKVPLDDLAEEERIPETLDGIPTDVEVMAPLRAR